MDTSKDRKIELVATRVACDARMNYRTLRALAERGDIGIVKTPAGQPRQRQELPVRYRVRDRHRAIRVSSDRILGRSEQPRLVNRSTVFATGNTIRLLGDMARRALVCSINAKVERPELRKFAADPVSRCSPIEGDLWSLRPLSCGPNS